MKKLRINTLSISFKRKRVLSSASQIALLRRLSDLLAHGFTLTEAFSFLLTQIDLRHASQNQTIIDALKSGASCHQVLKLLNYPRTVIMLIYFAELFSQLQESIPHAINFMTRHLKAKRSLIKTIQYPIVLITIFLVMLIVLNQTIIPEFQNLYETMDVKLSPLQHYLTQFIVHLPSAIFFILLFLLLIIYVLRWHYKKLPPSQKITFAKRLPLIASYYKFFKTYRHASEFALFYNNGVTLSHIVHIYGSQTEDSYLTYLASQIKFGTEQGLQLSDILKEVGCFQPELLSFIEQGEKKRKLDVELQLYSAIVIEQI
ncbi:competence type IV pilus assembly protein ComGB [Staphylococcus auricularis]|uniref:competence type IV pilus assembly protein ComGB n=1 Tax=Staphylococcus auricularis TaxID=29379 RepID=UPI003EBF64CC